MLTERNKPLICLGTVQFGMDYGITNLNGKVRRDEAERVLLKSRELGIELFDTAQSYGDSEKLLGEYLRSGSGQRVISKLAPKRQDSWSECQEDLWQRDFDLTLRSLNLRQLDTFLVHSASELRGVEGIRLRTWLRKLKDRGLTKRLGLSIYDGEDIDSLSLEDFDVIQLPFSIYNQRSLRDGTIEGLCTEGKEIHVRSIFLQGLILASADEWPGFINQDFRRHHQKIISRAAGYGLSMLDLAVGFVAGIDYIHTLVIGVTTVEELEEVYAAYRRSIANRGAVNACLSDLAWEDAKDVDPRLWPSAQTIKHRSKQ